MSWVTPQQIAEQAGKHVQSVRRAMRAAGVMPEPVPGILGRRIPVSKANRFLARQWPGTPPIKEEEQ